MLIRFAIACGWVLLAALLAAAIIIWWVLSLPWLVLRSAWPGKVEWH